MQRVSSASVRVDDETVGEIGTGLVVLLGVHRDDTETDARWLADKILHLRIFDDARGVMNCSLDEVGGSLLVVSQFTLHGDCRKGRRPSWNEAAPPETAKPLYEYFVGLCQAGNPDVRTGVFQAEMQLSLTNDGPVTLLLDSFKNF